MGCAKIYIFEDAGELSRVFPGRGPSFKLGIRSRVIAPLIANDRVIGLFYAHSKEPDAYDESDRQLAEQIANHSVVFDEVYESFAVEVKKILPSDRISIAALSPDGSKIIPSFVNGLDDPDMTKGPAIEVAGTMAEEVFEHFAELANRVVPFDRIAIAVIDWERQIISSLHHYGDTVEGRSFGDETPLKGTTVLQ